MAMSLPDQGETAECRLCGQEIIWEFDDPDPRSDNPFGLWVGDTGDVCPATDENADDQQHQPIMERS